MFFNFCFLFLGKGFVEFSRTSYSSSESAKNITVTLQLRGATSDKDININVIPSNWSPVSAEGKRCVFLSD